MSLNERFDGSRQSAWSNATDDRRPCMGRLIYGMITTLDGYKEDDDL